MWLISACFSLILFTLCSFKAVPTSYINEHFIRKHSIVRPYFMSGILIPHWDLMGSAIMTNTYIRLTPDSQYKFGALWNKEPSQVRNWELQVQLRVHGESSLFYGDGIAIFFTNEPLKAGDVFGSADYFNGLGVFLDTVSRHEDQFHEHPYMSAVINNGSIHYDHDVNGTHSEIGGCSVNFRNSGYDSYISIRYVKDTLTVSTKVDDKDTWDVCFSAKGVKLPTGYYFGVSASTGVFSDNHDIISMKLFEIDNPVDTNEDRSKIVPAASFFAPPRDHIETCDVSEINNILITIIALFGITVCLLGYLIVRITERHTYAKRYTY